MNQSYRVKINDKLILDLPLVITEKFSYFSFNMMGKTLWNRIIGNHLANLIISNEFKWNINALVTIESKALGLAQVLSENLNIDQQIIFRKSRKSYMKNPHEFFSNSILSGDCSYWIDNDELLSLKDKNILIVDDVISTGGTMNAVIEALNTISTKPKLISCVLTEGTKWSVFKGIDVISCGHIPIIERKQEND